MNSIGKIVQQAQKLNSICLGLSCIRESGATFANGRLEELNGLVASLKTFCKPAV